MLLKYYLYYGAFILPIITILLFTYRKNPKIFLLGILLSMFIFNFLYSNSIWLNFLSFNGTCIERINLINKNRNIAPQLFNGEVYSILYSIFIGLIIWNLLNFKLKNKIYSFYVFSKTSSFFFIVALASLVDILLGYLKPFCWDTVFFSFFVFPIFLLIGIDKKFFHTKTKTYKTSNVTIVILTLALLLSFILLLLYLGVI